jgi:hypothetical protein
MGLSFALVQKLVLLHFALISVLVYIINYTVTLPLRMKVCWGRSQGWEGGSLGSPKPFLLESEAQISLMPFPPTHSALRPRHLWGSAALPPFLPLPPWALCFSFAT